MFTQFLKALVREIVTHGKMLVGYLILVTPWLSDYPMLLAALKEAGANPSAENLTKLVGQAVLAFGAGHRVVKIIQGVVTKM